MDPTTSFGQSGQLPRTWRFAALLDREFWWNRAVNYAISPKPGILVLGGLGIVGGDVSAAWRAPVSGIGRPRTARSHQNNGSWCGVREGSWVLHLGEVASAGVWDAEAADCSIPPNQGSWCWVGRGSWATTSLPRGGRR